METMQPLVDPSKDDHHLFLTTTIKKPIHRLKNSFYPRVVAALKAADITQNQKSSKLRNKFQV